MTPNGIRLMPELIPSLLLASAQAPDQELRSATLQDVPIDGQLEKPIAPADQNLFLLVIFPFVLIVAGAILYLAKRSPADSDGPKNGGEKGGLLMMLVGFVLAAMAFIYVMIA